VDADRLSRWEETFRYYSLAYYYELLSSALTRRWDRWGGGASFVIFLTSSGSAISGWAVWHHDQAGSVAWAILVGAASLLSVFQSRLNVQSHIKTQRLLRKRFSEIRNALQVVLFDIVAGKDLAAIDRQLSTQRTRYFALTASIDPDLAETRRLRQRVKADRDVVLNELGFFEKGILKTSDGAGE
jgi:hypothetical protein